ncbi:hypothetical protein DSW25_13555 [Sulfitobacter donghicola DSW-25 = KCTC 12864 = JCM 14565]|uniref:Uncharacterized protein n=1 Tax=Sulfitobacter donghicola DSW-25 = KCTC 12864 = JCM 14565 TaxID=1300350 RepID=A0A073IH85_9RHOB|nr:hypothetical protein DSW25_13555 [Sulfitobacter donghicola DSW-25 = KCTC 12864 = JCM 14565]
MQEVAKTVVARKCRDIFIQPTPKFNLMLLFVSPFLFGYNTLSLVISGSEFCSHDYQKILRQHGFEVSKIGEDLIALPLRQVQAFARM